MSKVSLAFAVPGDLASRTGGYIYDRRVMDELRARGIAVDHIPLPSRYPFPEYEDIQETLALLNARPAAQLLVVDGLAWGAMPHEMACQVCGPIIALCHHPLGLEAGFDPAQAQYLLDNEKSNLAISDRNIVTSANTAQTLIANFSVPVSRISIAEPGIDKVARATGSASGCIDILTVGALVPRKGHDVLIDALSQLQDLPWRLQIVGSLDRAREWSAGIEQKIAYYGLQARIVLCGECDDNALAQLYAASDLFVSASHYEGYGMVLAEAMAYGLPIVSTTGGAAADTVPETCAIKIAPGDMLAMVQALRTAMENSALRTKLAEASWKAGQRLPRWSDTASVFVAVTNKILAEFQP